MPTTLHAPANRVLAALVVASVAAPTLAGDGAPPTGGAFRYSICCSSFAAAGSGSFRAISVWGAWSSGVLLLLSEDGTVSCLNTSATATCNPCPGLPANLPPIRSMSVAASHGALVAENGSVFVFGGLDPNCLAELEVPANLPPVVQAEVGDDHVLVRLTTGELVSWGQSNPYNSRTVPTDVGAAIDIAAVSFTSAAVRTNGTVAVWGQMPPISGTNTVPPPANLSNAIDVELGLSHVLVLRSDGTLATWGSASATTIPQTVYEVPIRAISAGGLGSAALRTDGSVVLWGNSSFGSLSLPTAPPIRQIELEANMIAMLVDPDCDGNGVPDANELAQNDCNANGIHDVCDIMLSRLEDCNGNGVGDSCETDLRVTLASGQLGPIGYTSPQSWTISDFAEALPATTGSLRIRGFGDFDNTAERVVVRIGGFTREIYLGGQMCTTSPWRTISVPASALHAAVATNGSLQIEVIPEIAVNAFSCVTPTWVEMDLTYTANTSADCNANGLLDECEIADGLAKDANGNGVIDQCETEDSACVADLDGDSAVGSTDLAILLDAWSSPKPDPAADLNGNGVIDGADLSLLLQRWGQCVK
jgi:alpha-tubulin suppressor-like RCC1 family protein